MAKRILTKNKKTMFNNTTTKIFHLQYAKRCAEIDYMVYDISHNEIPNKVDRYRRFTHENLRTILTEKLLLYANKSATRNIITSKDLDEVRLKKTYTVNWFESEEPIRESFKDRDSAEKFARILRKRSQLTIIKSRNSVIVKREMV